MWSRPGSSVDGVVLPASEGLRPHWTRVAAVIDAVRCNAQRTDRGLHLPAYRWIVRRRPAKRTG